ncbi:hypothetical protein CAC42_3700 [Sphaceloma murrayae]|uniref:Uncharacterized protein n=1 Tax=Sphaceloma murrayae TaxID=2082308 RepID=A0A2K1QGX9_9PEZI|nr:hypothetical protein CAC42_3700 [Sphaceloma murrayae]
MAQPQLSSGPPYASPYAAVGGRPTAIPDLPLLVVFLVLYIAGAASNMTIFQLNRRRGHKFIISLPMFGFCMARITTCVLRVVQTYRPTNIRLAIAAAIFLNAGVLIAYVVVLLLCIRILRALQPQLGWSNPLRLFIKLQYIILALALLLVIAFTVVNLYTLDAHLKTAALWIQRAAILYMLLFNLLSTAVLLLCVMLPRHTAPENFGQGSIAKKLAIASTANLVCVLIAAFRCGTVWVHPRPLNQPGWWHSKAALYAIEFGLEIVVIYLLIIMRFDLVFWVPNGSNGPGDYSRTEKTEGAHIDA